MKMGLGGLVFVDWIYVSKCRDVPAPSHVLKDFTSLWDPAEGVFQRGPRSALQNVTQARV
jgi:hypothetical protein